ncbi:MAG: dihydropteroate synthase [Alphaproteobacteria bacterium]|nr:dihydropteroate synthase [Alphaproteobacteria bacterium]MDE2042455.1 dihydropteroate synthase [Alphaproteobacteria bacterium]MDE2340821.1 dihydropteroate synthase [Alphaproteobacteria bacterium]
MTPPPTATLYFRPTAFIDAPFGLDGQFHRLAGGLSFFSAYEVIAAEGGGRVSQQLVPVSALDDFIATLAPAQAEAARTTITNIISPRAPLQLGSRTIRLGEPQIMGILNMTPDSFSDGGRFIDDPVAAAGAGVAMAAQGAALIDVGGESTRPGAAAVWAQDEIARTVPVIERLVAAGTAVSIDTRQAETMEAAFKAGAHLINDVSALLHDSRSLVVAAAANVPVVLMHSPDPAKSLHGGAVGPDPLLAVYDWLEARIEAAVAGGVKRERILVDPGIGFGKGVAANLALINGLPLFHGLGCGLVFGASRKRIIGALANEAPVDARLGGSVALALTAAQGGAQIIRVHDVAETVQALKVWRGMRDAALTPVV